MNGAGRTGPWVFGFVTFAAVMMMMIGIFHAFAGLAAIFEDTFYVLGREYIFEFDVTTWGWIHLIGGIIVATAGFFVLAGARWAVIVGIIVASLSAVVNFAFIPYYPVWSLLILALDILVIWALTVYGRELAA